MTRFHAPHVRKPVLSFGAVALLAMTAATAQVAGAPGDTGIDTSGNYRLEVQACNSGRTQEDRDTCLREARNARADKQRGTLDKGADYRGNALARCTPLAGEEKAACEARVMGYGDASGSVASGGVLRQVETVVVPPGQTDVTIEPRTDDPVILVPTEPSPRTGSPQ
ncbi:hypothetical protein [Ramlibacter algicola]|uniref:Secreted protein n=1 Tax=Ramlibacter algicola TaxID=2795217 RepID=A0A934PZ89_9BURK|nr:hypothetical protein [Ramlibacter algicola]